MKEIESSLDLWVVRTFSPLVEKYGVKKISLVKKTCIYWTAFFFGAALISWFAMFLTFLVTGALPENALTMAWTQIVLCVISYPGYLGWQFTERVLPV